MNINIDHLKYRVVVVVVVVVTVLAVRVTLVVTVVVVINCLGAGELPALLPPKDVPPNSDPTYDTPASTPS
jgi:hypothetical protein